MIQKGYILTDIDRAMPRDSDVANFVIWITLFGMKKIGLGFDIEESEVTPTRQ